MLPGGGASWSESPVQELQPGEAVYFVHSFMAIQHDQRTVSLIASTAAARISAAMGRETCSDASFTRKRAVTQV